MNTVHLQRINNTKATQGIYQFSYKLIKKTQCCCLKELRMIDRLFWSSERKKCIFRFLVYLILKLTFESERIDLEQQSIDLSSVLVINHSLMGKKTTKKQLVLSSQELVRHASLKLERHLFRTRCQHIQSIIESSHSNIKHSTYEHCKDLLRQTKKEALMTVQIKSDSSKDQDSDDVRMEIRKKERLETQFSEMLDKSLANYEKTSAILKNVSLKQKYGRLLGYDSEQQQKVDRPLQALQEQQQIALTTIKKLYRRYKVSNMFRDNVCSKIRKNYVERLIRKGFIKEHNKILTLTC